MAADADREEADGDARLLEAWIDGDVEAGKTLVSRHYRRLLMFFYSKVGSEVGRDLTQATFETVCASKLQFRGESSFTTYLFGIARWKLVHYFRTHRTHSERFEPLESASELPGVERSLTSMFMGKHREMLVVRALRSLSIDDQIVLELKDYEGMTAREIGEIFGVGRDTMSTRINRARSRLTTAITRLAHSASMSDSTVTSLDECMKQIRGHLRAAVGG